LRRSTTAIVYLELAKRAPEKLKGFAKDVAPTLFVGRFDVVEENSKIFNEAWNEGLF